MPPGSWVARSRSRSGTGLAGCLDPLERPDEDVLARREVEQRPSFELEPVRRHRVQLEVGIRGRDAPRGVMDLGAVQARSIRGVETVALCQEVLETPGPGGERLAGGTVRAGEDERPGRPPAFARVVNAVAAPVDRDTGVEVRQLVDTARRLDRTAARGIEAEEPDPQLLLRSDVRAHVDLGEARDHR